MDIAAAGHPDYEGEVVIYKRGTTYPFVVIKDGEYGGICEIGEYTRELFNFNNDFTIKEYTCISEIPLDSNSKRELIDLYNYFK